MKKQKIRPVGEITTDMEKYLSELAYDHEMQHHEILGLVLAWLIAHNPEGTEPYTDGALPFYYYGHPDGIKSIIKSSKS